MIKQIVFIKKVCKTLYDFFDDDTTVHAASLSYHTIFNCVPIFVVCTFLLSHFSLIDANIEVFKENIWHAILPVINASNINVIFYVNTFFQNVEQLGVFGGFYIVVASLLFVGSFNYTIERITKKKKSYYLSVMAYICFVVVLPILIFSLKLLSTLVVNWLYFDFFKNIFLSILTTFVIFVLAFKFMSLQSFKSVAISSILCTVLWNLGKDVFIFYTQVNTPLITIYGSFTTVMFYILWLYVSWLIFLYGLKFCISLDYFFEKKEPRNNFASSIKL